MGSRGLPSEAAAKELLQVAREFLRRGVRKKFRGFVAASAHRMPCRRKRDAAPVRSRHGCCDGMPGRSQGIFTPCKISDRSGAQHEVKRPSRQAPSAPAMALQVMIGVRGEEQLVAVRVRTNEVQRRWPVTAASPIFDPAAVPASTDRRPLKAAAVPHAAS
jgi:hypothetical protein